MLEVSEGENATELVQSKARGARKVRSSGGARPKKSRGLKIPRVLTVESVSPYDAVEWELRRAAIDPEASGGDNYGPDGFLFRNL